MFTETWPAVFDLSYVYIYRTVADVTLWGQLTYITSYHKDESFGRA